MKRVLLLEDSNGDEIPEHFQNLLRSIEAERSFLLKYNKTVLDIFSLENDYLLCVLVTVAVECGFRLERSLTANFDLRVSKTIAYNPQWRDSSRRLYTVDLYLAKLINDRFVLMLVPVLGSSTLVNLISLKEKYVERSAVEVIEPARWLPLLKVSEMFHGLSALAKSVRKFLQREKDLALNSANEPNPSLLGIPEELKRYIFRLISAKEFVRLTGTCKAMQSYNKDPAVWKHYLKRDFNSAAVDPYSNYVEKYCTAKVIAPSYPDLEEEVIPMVLTRTTSTSILNNYIRL